MFWTKIILYCSAAVFYSKWISSFSPFPKRRVGHAPKTKDQFVVALYPRFVKDHPILIIVRLRVGHRILIFVIGCVILSPFVGCDGMYIFLGLRFHLFWLLKITIYLYLGCERSSFTLILGLKIFYILLHNNQKFIISCYYRTNKALFVERIWTIEVAA